MHDDTYQHLLVIHLSDFAGMNSTEVRIALEREYRVAAAMVVGDVMRKLEKHANKSPDR